jgi:hypothetical protein
VLHGADTLTSGYESAAHAKGTHIGDGERKGHCCRCETQNESSGKR